MAKIYGYCRVSTTEQADDGVSLAAQKQQITGYAMMKGWKLAEVFIEAGVSGSVPLSERPEGRRLLQAVSKGAVVITAKLDRMFRSAADALVTLEELKGQGVALHMIDLGGDVTGNGISKMVFRQNWTPTNHAKAFERPRTSEIGPYFATMFGAGHVMPPLRTAPQAPIRASSPQPLRLGCRP